jgi:hypothetical protein
MCGIKGRILWRLSIEHMFDRVNLSSERREPFGYCALVIGDYCEVDAVVGARLGQPNTALEVCVYGTLAAGDEVGVLRMPTVDIEE